jgi:hypothetical protein
MAIKKMYEENKTEQTVWEDSESPYHDEPEQNKWERDKWNSNGFDQSGFE